MRFRAGTAAFLFLILPLAVQTPAQPAGEGDRAQDLGARALAVRSIDPADEDFSDLMPLAARIGNARVVQLGEATHGDGSTFLAKARLIRFLHQVMGFDVLAWEAGFFDVSLVDQALRSPMPVHEAGRLGLYRIWWNSSEVQPTLEYVRSTQSTARPIQTVGFDCRVSTAKARSQLYPEFVFGFFDRLDPQLILEWERADLAMMSASLLPVDYYEHPGPRTYNRALPRRLLSVIDERRAELLVRSTPQEIGYVRQTLVSLMNMDRALIEDDPQGYTRDAAMAENLLWLLRGPLKDRKVIVWAHNYHVMLDFTSAERVGQETESQAGPMGRFLARALGREMYTVGFLSHHGRYGYAGEPPEDLPAAEPGSLGALLHTIGRPYLFLDFRGLPPDHWLRCNPTTAGFYFHNAMATDWPRIYDAVFFIDEMKPVVAVEGTVGAR